MGIAKELLEKYIRVDETSVALAIKAVKALRAKAFKSAADARNKRIVTGSSKPDIISQNNHQATDAQNMYDKVDKFIKSKNDPETSVGKRYWDSQGQRTPWGAEFDRAIHEE